MGWLELIVLLVWAPPAVIGSAFLARRMWAARACIGAGSRDGRYWETGVRVALVLGVAAVAVRATLARLPGWNPESLWNDDLVYGAIIRGQDLWSVITAPIHVAPGLFVIWRWLYAVFPDPEWSLQILPFACGIAAIPVMALVVRNLTRDDGLALLAAALTALNPLLAHYTEHNAAEHHPRDRSPVRTDEDRKAYQEARDEDRADAPITSSCALAARGASDRR